MKESLNNAIINMTSVNDYIRNKGMKFLKENFYNLDKETYQKVSYGIFFYFWFSDGYERQQEDID